MKTFSLMLLVLLISTAATAKDVKYVILFVGDGFGYNQRLLVEAYLGRKMVMSNMETSVRTNTNNILGKTTDSAASGTAIACGLRTINRAIGVDQNLRPLESIARRLKAHNFMIGLVSSSPLNDATPAVFYAHQEHRKNHDSISAQIPLLPVDYLSGAKLSGNREAAEELLKSHNYNVVSGDQAFESVTKGKKSYAVTQPFTFWTPDTPKSGYTLAEHTAKAIEMLDNPNGFFLMVENGYTDYLGHANDAGTLMREAVALEDAVQVGLDFLAAHPDETLIIYTSDHETGGLDIDNMLADNLGILLHQTATIWDITKMFAKERFETQDTAIDFMQQKLGLTEQPFTAQEREEIKKKVGTEIDNALITAAFAVRDQRCGIRYTSNRHSNSPIVTNASGVDAHVFKNALANSDIPHLIKSVVIGDTEPDLNHRLTLGSRMEHKFCQIAGKPVSANILNVTNYSYIWGQDAIKSVFTIPYNTIEATTFAYSDTIHAVKIVNNSGLHSLKFRLEDVALPSESWFFGWFKSEGFYVYDAVSFVCYGMMSELPELSIAAKSSMLLLLSTQPLKEFQDSYSSKPFIPTSLREAVNVSNANEVITIDGKLDEESWSEANFYDFVDASGSKPKDAAIGAMLVDPAHNQTIYIGVKLTDAELISNVTARDGALWSDDCIDLHLSGTNGDAIQFIINANGVFYDAQNEKPQWNTTGVQVATSRTNSGWILEMAVAMSELKITGPLRGNIARQHRPSHSFSGLFAPGNSLHDSAFWGTFIMSKPQDSNK